MRTSTNVVLKSVTISLLGRTTGPRCGTLHIRPTGKPHGYYKPNNRLLRRIHRQGRVERCIARLYPHRSLDFDTSLGRWPSPLCILALYGGPVGDAYNRAAIWRLWQAVSCATYKMPRARIKVKERCMQAEKVDQLVPSAQLWFP
jgi:hypothetical protein